MHYDMIVSMHVRLTRIFSSINDFILGLFSHNSICDDHQSIIEGLISSSAVLVGVLFAVSTISVTVMLFLAKAKAKLVTELNILKDSTKTTATYEDINIFPINTQTIKVNDNVAYSNVADPMQKQV